MRLLCLQGQKVIFNALLYSLPNVQEIGFENFIDVLAVCGILPNCSGYEQSRIDGTAVSYMPCVQPSFLQDAFSLPIAERKNSRLVYNFIKKWTPELTAIPLVKGTTTYPYNFSTIQSWLWRKVKMKMNLTYRNLEPTHFLFHIKEFVLDTLLSSEVKKFEGYNYIFIEKSVSEFYNGKSEFINIVDWWLSFELWRQSLKKNSY